MEISSQEKILIEIVKVLDDLKIKYFITGDFAVCGAGQEPHLTWILS